jgi:hypothetical protein
MQKILSARERLMFLFPGVYASSLNSVEVDDPKAGCARSTRAGKDPVAVGFDL